MEPILLGNNSRVNPPQFNLDLSASLRRSAGATRYPPRGDRGAYPAQGISQGGGKSRDPLRKSSDQDLLGMRTGPVRETDDPLVSVYMRGIIICPSVNQILLWITAIISGSQCRFRPDDNMVAVSCNVM